MNKRIEELSGLCRRHEVSALYAFGSRAEEVRDWIDGKIAYLSASDSDIDIGIHVTRVENWPVNNKVNFALALESFFKSSRVDLVILNEADPFLASGIVRGERLYARNEFEADEYDLYVLRRAGDLAPLERERMALLLGEPT
jgi:predicted nucleotidyltransferase